MALTRTRIFWRIVLHWCVVSLVAAFVCSLFSTFYPYYRWTSYFEYGFEWKSLEYFIYTLYFFVALSAAIAAPGFAANLYLYFRAAQNNRIGSRLLSIIANTVIAATVLFVYSFQGITKSEHIIAFLTPTYLASTLIFGLLLPRTV